MSTSLQPEFLPLKGLATYSGLSVRKLRDCLRDPIAPLPYYQPAGGKVLVRVTEFHEWMQRFRRQSPESIDSAVEDILRKVS